MASIRRPTGVVGTCANGYLGYTGTWDNLLSPTERNGRGHPYKKALGYLVMIATR